MKQLLSVLGLFVIVLQSFGQQLNPDFQTVITRPASIAATAEQADGKILLGGSISRVDGQIEFNIVRLNTNGQFDATFNPSVRDTFITSIDVQDDQKILVGGYSRIDDQENGVVFRLNADGSFDPTFAADTFDNRVQTVIELSNGRIAVGGIFSNLAGQSSRGLIQLNSNGSIARTFNLVQGDGTLIIYDLLEQGDQFYAGGNIDSDAELYRFSNNGVRDNNFTIDEIIGDNDFMISIRQLAALSNGNIAFTTYTWEFDPQVVTVTPNGDRVVRQSIPNPFGLTITENDQVLVAGEFEGRSDVYLADGTDLTPFVSGPQADDQVYNLLTLSNGNILVTGRFGLYKTRIREGVALINPNNRTIDGSFQPFIQRSGLVNRSIALGDQLLVAGDFTQINGNRVVNLARLNDDGSLDQSFQQTAIPSSKAINNIFIQSDGKIMVGTSASSLDPDPHVPVNRLNADGSTDNGFQIPGDLSVLGNVNGFNQLADGRLVVHGSYSILTDNGFFRQIGIFNQNGDFDPTLSNSISASSLNAVVMVDGNLLIGGNRIRIGDGPQSPMVLVSPTGQEVTGFTSTLALTSNVQEIFPLNNEQFLVSGQLFDGVNFRELARVNANGALDISFDWPLFGSSRPPVFPPRDVVELPSGDLLISNSEISASSSLWLTDSEGNPKDTIVVAERAFINDLAPASDTVFYVGGAFTIDAQQTSLVQLQLFQADTSSNPNPETFSGFYITSDSVEVGEQVCVSFNASDLSDVLGIQLVINYDAEKLAFDSITNLNLSGLLEADFGLPGSSGNPPGIIRLVWIEPGLSGVSVSDTAQWFDLCFTAVATADSTEITISETEIVDLNDNLFSVTTQAGKISITEDMSVSADTLFVNLNDEQVKQGEEVCLQVSVSDFDFIAGMQFNLNYDPAKLDFKEIRNLNLEMLTPGSFGLPGVGANPPGRIKVSWFDLEVNGISVPDETVIFEICFTALAETGTDDITFSNTEIIGNENESIEFVGQASTISFLPADDITQPTFALSAGDATVAQGEEVCIPITVTNFEDLIGVGFKMTYDPSVLSYDRVRGFNLPNLNRGSFDEPGDGATPLGEIEVNWLDFTLNGINLDDGTAIFEVCFKALAESGSTALGFSEETILNSDNELVDFNSDAGIISFTPNTGVMADTLIIDIASDTVGLEELFCIPVRVEAFEDIVGLEFTINYDTNLLTFENVGNFNLSGLENSVTRPGEGVIPFGEFKVAWFDARVEGVNLPDSSILFEMCFSSKASEATATLSFSDVEITGLVVDNVPFEGKEGSILIDENGGQTGFDNDDFLLQVIGDTVLTDDKFCLPVFAKDFDGIADLSFSLFYDPMVLRFDSVSALAFADLGDNITEVQVEGETLRTIRVNWSNDAEQGQSLPDSTQLMSFCFTAIDIGQTIVALGTGSVQDATGEPVAFQSENSRVVVNSRIISEDNFFTVKVSSDTVDQDDSFCLDISVDNFEDILSVKFNLNYDPSLLQFDSLSGFNLSGLDDRAFDLPVSPNPPGQISMNWIDTTLSGISKSDGSLLFQACFTAIAEDALSIITITGPSILNNQGQTLSFLGEGGTVFINDVVTSTDDAFEQSTSFKLYPIPARSELTMEWSGQELPEELPLYIVNLEGKVVHTGQVRNSKQTFSIDHLAPGIYYLVVKEQQKLQYKQFLKL